MGLKMTHVSAFVEKHPDVILASLGLAMLLCLGMLFVVLCLCWKRFKDRNASNPRYEHVGGKVRLRGPPVPDEGKRRSRYSQLKSSPDGNDSDVFDTWRGDTRVLSASRKNSSVDVNVYAPRVIGEVLPNGCSSLHCADRRFPTQSVALVQEASAAESGGVDPKTVLPPTQDTSRIPPYATPLLTGRRDELTVAADDRTAKKKESAARRSSSPFGSRRSSMPTTAAGSSLSTATPQQSIDRLRGLIRQGAARRQISRPESPKCQVPPVNFPDTAASPPPPPTDSPAATSQETLASIPPHRCASPSASAPAWSANRARSLSVHAAQLPGNRNHAILASMNQQHISKQTQASAPGKALKRMGKVSKGQLGAPSGQRRSRYSMTRGGLAEEAQRTRKISRSLPNLNDPGEESGDEGSDPLARAMSTATFSYVFSTSESRNTSPTVDEESVTRFGALLFRLRYDRFQQALVVSHLRCSQLPETRTGGRPDTYVKCRVLMDRSLKLKTKIVQESRDPVYVGDVMQFGPYSSTEVRQCSLLFSVVTVRVLHQKRVIGQCLYKVSETPQLAEAMPVFRNLDAPGPKARRKRLVEA